MFRKQLSDVGDLFNSRPTTVTRSTPENRQTGSWSTASKSAPLATISVSDVTASGSSQPEPEVLVGVAITRFAAVAGRISGRSSMAPSVISQWTRLRRDVAAAVDVDTSGVDRFRLGDVRSRQRTEVAVATRKTATTNCSLWCILSTKTFSLAADVCAHFTANNHHLSTSVNKFDPANVLRDVQSFCFDGLEFLVQCDEVRSLNVSVNYSEIERLLNRKKIWSSSLEYLSLLVDVLCDFLTRFLLVDNRGFELVPTAGIISCSVANLTLKTELQSTPFSLTRQDLVAVSRPEIDGQVTSSLTEHRECFFLATTARQTASRLTGNRSTRNSFDRK